MARIKESSRKTCLNHGTRTGKLYMTGKLFPVTELGKNSNLTHALLARLSGEPLLPSITGCNVVQHPTMVESEKAEKGVRTFIPTEQQKDPSLCCHWRAIWGAQTPPPTTVEGNSPAVIRPHLTVLVESKREKVKRCPSFKQGFVHVGLLWNLNSPTPMTVNEKS